MAFRQMRRPVGTYCAGSVSSLIRSWMMGGGSTGFRSAAVARDVSRSGLHLREACHRLPETNLSLWVRRPELARDPVGSGAHSPRWWSTWSVDDLPVARRKTGIRSSTVAGYLRSFTRDEAASTKVWALIKGGPVLLTRFTSRPIRSARRGGMVTLNDGRLRGQRVVGRDFCDWSLRVNRLMLVRIDPGERDLG